MKEKLTIFAWGLIFVDENYLKVKFCSEAGNQHCVTKSYVYIHESNIYIVFFIGIPVIYYFPYDPEILVNK